MRNSLWTKVLGIGIITLFLGTNGLTNVTANIVNVNTSNQYMNNSVTMGITSILIGLIKDVDKHDHFVSFYSIVVFGVEFGPGGARNIVILPKNSLFSFEYNTKIGIITNHLIVGVFFYTVLYN